MSTTDELGEEYRTRPGTPMIGVYSVNQMDDFYAALAAGEVTPTGIMNYLQRLLITERCRPGDRVLDVCCGRGLQLPVLYRYRPDLAGYVGLDISADNLAEATARQAVLDAARPRDFSIDDINHCLRRHAEREGAPMTDEEQHLVTRVARLYQRQAEHEPDRIRIVHRAGRSEDDIVAEMEHLALTGTGER